MSHRGWALLVVAGLAIGCQKISLPKDLPELHSVTISVVQDGQPLVAASVTLHATDSKWAVGGSTDSAGRARMQTVGKYPGAPSGTYKVCISKELTEGGSQPSNDPSTVTAPSVYYDLVDQQFKLPDSTPLEIKVAAGAGEPHLFDVGAAIKKRLARPE